MQPAFDTVEIGILVSSLYRQLDDLTSRQIDDADDLIVALVALEGVSEEFGLLFSEEGTNAPELALAFEEATLRIRRVTDRLLGMASLPSIRWGIIDKVVNCSSDQRREPVLVAFECDPNMARLADPHRLLLWQGTLAGTLDKGVSRVPAAVVTTLTRRSIGVFELVDHDYGREELEAAVTLWEPYHEGAEFATFEAALGAAIRLS